MTPRTKIGTLGDAHAATYFHLDEIINPNTFSDPAMISNPQLPRELYPCPRFDHNSASDCTAE